MELEDIYNKTRVHQITAPESRRVCKQKHDCTKIDLGRKRSFNIWLFCHLPTKFFVYKKQKNKTKKKSFGLLVAFLFFNANNTFTLDLLWEPYTGSRLTRLKQERKAQQETKRETNPDVRSILFLFLCFVCFCFFVPLSPFPSPHPGPIAECKPSY